MASPPSPAPAASPAPRSHEARVNTVPTQSAASLGTKVAVTVVFDVANIERTAAFYSEMLGFRVSHAERAGMPYETRVLVSDRYPAVVLFARQSFQRPVLGSMIGSVIQVGLRDPDLAARAAELEGRVTWVLAPGAAPAGEGPRISFLDPDGYVIELFG